MHALAQEPLRGSHEVNNSLVCILSLSYLSPKVEEFQIRALVSVVQKETLIISLLSTFYTV